MGFIKQNIHNIARGREIMRVMAKYGFGHLLHQLHIERHVIGARILRPLVKTTIYAMPAEVRLRKALEELGPTFIKFGQVLSMRPDILPLEFTIELEKLQDKVPELPYYIIETEIEQELKKKTGELFASVSPVPIASASLAQVHEARLNTGESVIIKVQRPGIEATIDNDISILYQLAYLAERYYKRAQLFDPVGIVDEFRSSIKRELDFVNESFNVERFQRQFKDDPAVYIPAVFQRFTTTKILVLEKVDGIKITDTETLEKAGLDRKSIAKNGVQAILKQIFIYGFFHADPHAGNILVKGGNIIVFLDFGMAGRIHSSVKGRLLNALGAIVDRDMQSLREAALSLGNARAPVDLQDLELDLDDMASRYYGRPLKELNISRIVADSIGILSRYKIRLPPDLLLLSKVLVIADGIGRKLDPDFNLVAEAKPFVQDTERRRYAPSAVAKNLRVFLRWVIRFAKALPQDMVAIIGKMKQGEFRIEFEHRGLEQLTSEIDRSSNRVSFSLIVSALVIGSSILVHSNRGPEYLGLPLLGLLGYLIAGIIGIWLVIVIIRSGQF